MNRRHLAKGIGVLGVALIAGCSTASTSWLPWTKPGETPSAKPTLPPFGEVIMVGQLSKKQFAPGETITMDVRSKALSFNGPMTLTAMWCDGYNASKSVDTTQTRVIQHPAFDAPRDCWVEVELFNMEKVQIGDASVSFTIATGSVPTPAPTAAPTAPAPATPAPATPAPTLAPILPYRLPS